jgi:hypothetical protein
LSTLLGTLCRQHSRASASIAFGSATMVGMYFAWLPSARRSPGAIYLSVAAGVAHALAGAIVGPSLVDPARTPSDEVAVLRGAGTSLLALAFFAIAFSGYLFVADGWPTTMANLLALPLLTALFAFLSAGWGLLLLSALIGWGMRKLVT